MVIRDNSGSFPSPVADSVKAPQVSVIVATTDAAASIDECLRSVQLSLAGLDSELIVVDASRDGTADRVERDFPGVPVIRMPPGTLAPRLWSAGLAQARGDRIAFMTGHSAVVPGWIAALIGALREGAAGAGGPIVLKENSSLTDAAIYFLRYSAFMPTSRDSPYPAAEIAGDNSMYRGELLRSHMASFADGFWEVPFHSILRSQGETLATVPAATIDFGQSFSLGAISSQRFEHGRHFGKWRVSEGGLGKARIMLATPVVPFVLMTRILRRAIATGAATQADLHAAASRPQRLRLGRLVAASPLILWLGACWAFGEARGAWEG